MPTAEPVECVAFMLVDAAWVLAEKRKVTKRLAPGAIALPGGHVEAGESIEDALRRERQIRVHEAEALVWVPLADAARLDLDVDRLAVAEYLRMCATPSVSAS